jgi:four helix bundle protein
LILIL